MVRWPPCGLGVSCASTAAESRAKIWCQWGSLILAPPVAWAAVRSGVVVLLLLTFCLLLLPLWESVIVLCLYVHSSIAIILMGKRELVALLNLSSWCLVMIERLFLAVPWGLSAACDCGIS